MSRQVSSDTGPFAIVPEWLLYSPVSDKALRLYAVLGRFADDDGGCYPGRKALADRMGCSENSVDRAVADLRDSGALIVEPRFEDGAQKSNRYTILRKSPLVGTPLPTVAPTPLPMGGEQNESHIEREGSRPVVSLETGPRSRGDGAAS